MRDTSIETDTAERMLVSIAAWSDPQKIPSEGGKVIYRRCDDIPKIRRFQVQGFMSVFRQMKDQGAAMHLLTEHHTKLDAWREEAGIEEEEATAPSHEEFPPQRDLPEQDPHHPVPVSQ